jgi:hypothetical protein
MDLWSPGTAGCVGALDGKDLPMLTGSRGRELAILVRSGDRVELVVGFRSGSPGWLSEYKGFTDLIASDDNVVIDVLGDSRVRAFKDKNLIRLIEVRELRERVMVPEGMEADKTDAISEAVVTLAYLAPRCGGNLRTRHVSKLLTGRKVEDVRSTLSRKLRASLLYSGARNGFMFDFSVRARLRIREINRQGQCRDKTGHRESSEEIHSSERDLKRLQKEKARSYRASKSAQHRDGWGPTSY